jgi:hypothetical protein
VPTLMVLSLHSSYSFADAFDSTSIQTNLLSHNDCHIFGSCTDSIFKIFPFIQYKWPSEEFGNESQNRELSLKNQKIASIPFELPFP